MAMENKRIIQLSTERLTLNGDDYVMVDSETDGSAKYRLDRLKETDSTLSVSGMAADAAATGQAISAEATARGNAVSAEAQARAAADTALGNDINDLKSALQVSNRLATVMDTSITDLITVAGGVKNDGTDNDGLAGSYRRTPYIFVHTGDVIKYTLTKTATPVNMISLYGLDYSYISGVAGDSTRKNGSVTVAQDGYVRWCCDKDYVDNATCVIQKYSKTLIDENAQNIVKVNERVNDIGNIGLNLIARMVVGGVDSSGADVPNSNFKRNDYVWVSKGDVVKYYNIRANVFNVLSYYNTSKVYQSGIAGSYSGQDGTYTAPDDGYIRMCCSIEYIDTKGSTAVLYNQISKSAEKFENIYPSVQEVTKTVLPSYWQTYMATRILDIREKDALIGNHGDSFIFITDTHIPRNRMFSPNVCRYIYENSAVQKMVHGGDTLDISTGDNGKADAIAKLQKWQTDVYGLSELEVAGNHDLNNFNGQNSANALTVSEWYGIVMKHVEKECDTNGKIYYVYDNTSQKIRYIILDSEMDTYSNSLTFMENKLSELSSEWTALVIQHRYWYDENTIDTKGTQLQNAINAIYSNLNCTFAGVIVGHLHTDKDTSDATNGYPIIGVNCDAKDISVSGYTRNNATKDEQSFDVVHIDTSARKIYMTRIGAGDDIVGSGTGTREYDY